MRYTSIEFDEYGLHEWSGGMRAVSVPRADITGLELTEAVSAERPVLQFAFGLFLATIGVIGLYVLYQQFTSYDPVSDAFIWFGAFFPLGLWACFRALTRHTVLIVETRGDRRKLLFRGKLDRSALSAFIGALEENLDVRVRRNSVLLR